MRIGMVSTSLPEPDRKPGGVDVLVRRLARRLARRGHDVCLYSCSEPERDFPGEYRRLGSARLRHSRLGRTIAVPLLLNSRLRSDHDVLHLHGDDWFYLQRGLPTVRTFYGSAREEARTATSRRRRAFQSGVYLLELMAARQATATYALTPGAGSAYGAEGVLGCGIDVRPATPEQRSPAPSVLFVGTLDGRKRGRLVVEAFREVVAAALPDAQLWMVADAAPSRRGIVHLPRPDDRELAALYRRAWAFCLPSSYEGLGIPYLEAMAAGTPVIATANPGALHVLADGEAGRIVADRELGPALLEVLTDASARARLGEAGLRRAAEFSWNRVCAAYERAYEGAILRWRAGR
jgi:glycosyltransferase involved in cell wall biosynthesis